MKPFFTLLIFTFFAIHSYAQTCSGTTNLTACSGSVSDGSGGLDYDNNLDCKWLIQPAGATSIDLTFTAFDLESCCDYVSVYDGPTTSHPLLGSFNGTTLPPTLTASSGEMLIHFTTDISVTYAGWDANYTCSTAPPTYCSGTETLTDCIGSFTDGSSSTDYLNNADCKWLIQPPGATTIDLSFLSFDTEFGKDFVTVYDGATTSDPVIGTYSGSSLPPLVSSTGGSILVHFTSDGSITDAGWYASYTCSTIPVYCVGRTNISTCDGIIEDGSGSNDYLDNIDCEWLIQPAGATSISLTFSAFHLESCCDWVSIYDGPTTASPLLGSFNGSTVPPTQTSTGGSMLVKFTTDGSVTYPGWEAYYSCDGTPFCSGTTEIADCGGTVGDGSDGNNYHNNSDCKFLIKPTGATSIQLSFTEFGLEDGKDFLYVYDGETTSDPLLGTYTGSTMPPFTSSTQGTMLLHFTSDGSFTDIGFEAEYGCNGTGIENSFVTDGIKVYPNPTNGTFSVEFETRSSENILLRLINQTGQIIQEENLLNVYGYTRHDFDIQDRSAGLYNLQLISDQQVLSKTVMVR